MIKVGDKVIVKDNLKEELLNLTFDSETSESMAERFVGTKQEVFSLWTNEDGQMYATVDLCCEIPVQCLEVIGSKINEWISCSERLPNCNGCYLVWRLHFFGGEIGMPAICYFDGQDTWHDSYGVDFKKNLNKEDVLAWMPLPEPYKG